MKKSRWRIQRWKHNICQKNIVIFYGSISYTAHVAMNVRGVGAGGYVRKLMIRSTHPNCTPVLDCLWHLSLLGCNLYDTI